MHPFLRENMELEQEKHIISPVSTANSNKHSNFRDAEYTFWFNIHYTIFTPHIIIILIILPISLLQRLPYPWICINRIPIRFIIKMKGSISSYRAQNKKSCSPLKTASPCHSVVSSASALYFCHYRNAMYMGGVKNFKKDGKGLLIHDNGLTVLCSHHNDLLHNHNIFYSQHCLLSA